MIRSNSMAVLSFSLEKTSGLSSSCRSVSSLSAKRAASAETKEGRRKRNSDRGSWHRHHNSSSGSSKTTRRSSVTGVENAKIISTGPALDEEEVIMNLLLTCGGGGGGSNVGGGKDLGPLIFHPTSEEVANGTITSSPSASSSPYSGLPAEVAARRIRELLVPLENLIHAVEQRRCSSREALHHALAILRAGLRQPIEERPQLLLSLPSYLGSQHRHHSKTVTPTMMGSEGEGNSVRTSSRNKGKGRETAAARQPNEAEVEEGIRRFAMVREAWEATSTPEGAQSLERLPPSLRPHNVVYHQLVSSRSIPLLAMVEGVHSIAYPSVKLRVELLCLLLRGELQREGGELTRRANENALRGAEGGGGRRGEHPSSPAPLHPSSALLSLETSEGGMSAGGNGDAGKKKIKVKGKGGTASSNTGRQTSKEKSLSSNQNPNRMMKEEIMTLEEREQWRLEKEGIEAQLASLLVTETLLSDFIMYYNNTVRYFGMNRALSSSSPLEKLGGNSSSSSNSSSPLLPLPSSSSISSTGTTAGETGGGEPTSLVYPSSSLVKATLIRQYYELCDWILLVETAAEIPPISLSQITRVHLVDIEGAPDEPGLNGQRNQEEAAVAGGKRKSVLSANEKRKKKDGSLVIEIRRPSTTTPWGILFTQTGRLLDVDVAMRVSSKAKEVHQLLQRTDGGARIVAVNGVRLPPPPSPSYYSAFSVKNKERKKLSRSALKDPRPDGGEEEEEEEGGRGRGGGPLSPSPPSSSSVSYASRVAAYDQHLLQRIHQITLSSRRMVLEVSSPEFTSQALRQRPRELLFYLPFQGGEAASGQRACLVLHRRDVHHTSWSFSIEQVPPPQLEQGQEQQAREKDTSHSIRIHSHHHNGGGSDLSVSASPVLWHPPALSGSPGGIIFSDACKRFLKAFPQRLQLVSVNGVEIQTAGQAAALMRAAHTVMLQLEVRPPPLSRLLLSNGKGKSTKGGGPAAAGGGGGRSGEDHHHSIITAVAASQAGEEHGEGKKMLIKEVEEQKEAKGSASALPPPQEQQSKRSSLILSKSSSSTLLPTTASVPALSSSSSSTVAGVAKRIEDETKKKTEVASTTTISTTAGAARKLSSTVPLVDSFPSLGDVAKAVSEEREKKKMTSSGRKQAAGGKGGSENDTKKGKLPQKSGVVTTTAAAAAGRAGAANEEGGRRGGSCKEKSLEKTRGGSGSSSEEEKVEGTKEEKRKSVERSKGKELGRGEEEAPRSLSTSSSDGALKRVSKGPLPPLFSAAVRTSTDSVDSSSLKKSLEKSHKSSKPTQDDSLRSGRVESSHNRNNNKNSKNTPSLSEEKISSGKGDGNTPMNAAKDEEAGKKKKKKDPQAMDTTTTTTIKEKRKDVEAEKEEAGEKEKGLMRKDEAELHSISSSSSTEEPTTTALASSSSSSSIPPCEFENKIRIVSLSDHELVIERPSTGVPWGLPIKKISVPSASFSTTSSSSSSSSTHGAEGKMLSHKSKEKREKHHPAGGEEGQERSRSPKGGKEVKSARTHWPLALAELPPLRSPLAFPTFPSPQGGRGGKDGKSKKSSTRPLSPTSSGASSSGTLTLSSNTGESSSSTSFNIHPFVQRFNAQKDWPIAAINGVTAKNPGKAIHLMKSLTRMTLRFAR